MQSKVATLWQMRETTKKIAPADPENGGDIPQKSSVNLEPAHDKSSSLADTLEEQMPELFAAPGLPTQERDRARGIEELRSPRSSRTLSSQILKFP